MAENPIDEKFIGGFITGTFKRVGNFAGGYGVFTTTRRIVGVSPSRWFVVLLVGSVLGVIGLFSGLAAITHTIALQLAVLGGGGLIAAILAWGQKRLQKSDPHSIEELEARRDFEIYASNIVRIEIRQPGRVKRGPMKIIPLTGEGLNILITQQFQDYGYLKDLLAQFCATFPQIQFVEEE